MQRELKSSSEPEPEPKQKIQRGQFISFNKVFFVICDNTKTLDTDLYFTTFVVCFVDVFFALFSLARF